MPPYAIYLLHEILNIRAWRSYCDEVYGNNIGGLYTSYNDILMYYMSWTIATIFSDTMNHMSQTLIGMYGCYPYGYFLTGFAGGISFIVTNRGLLFNNNDTATLAFNVTCMMIFIILHRQL